MVVTKRILRLGRSPRAAIGIRLNGAPRVLNTDRWLGLGDVGGSWWCDRLLRGKCRTEVAVQSGLVARVWLDQGIDQRMLCLRGQHVYTNFLSQERHVI
jgi:hypothetical protein